MRIIVISDTHGDIVNARRVIAESEEIDLIIHLGDYFRDAEKLSNMFPSVPIEYIYGNSDFMVGNVSDEKLLEYYGKKIFITHGHKYSVKWSYKKLFRKAEEMKLDMVLFGHTHIAYIKYKGSYCIMNPGSISEPRDNSSESYAIIEINDESIKPKIVYI